MRAEAKWTWTSLTPFSLPTRFSIFLTHEGQEKPSARRVVWVELPVVVLMMDIPSFAFLVVVTPWWDDTSEVTKKDRKSTRLNSSHVAISYAVFCLKKKK